MSECFHEFTIVSCWKCSRFIDEACNKCGQVKDGEQTLSPVCQECGGWEEFFEQLGEWEDIRDE